MIFALSFFWLIRETKAILFWLYLWQLKEYRVPRLLAHFQTAKGKELLLSKLIYLKFFLVLVILSSFISGFFENIPEFLTRPSFLLLYFVIIFGILFFLYVAESLKALKDFFGKKLKVPILTKKILCLILTGLIIEILFLFILFKGMIFVYQMNVVYMYPKLIIGDSFYPLGLLVFDILTPLVVSIIVFLFQPLAILWRNQIIKKAKKKREKFKNLLVIGITGSYGKTSTKEFLATILSEKFKVLKTKEHQNTEVGVPQCILNDLKPEHEIFICEMGAYKRGEIKLLCDITKPKIGILTGINEQHLAIFGSQENIIKGKYELIESLPEDGIAFFNEKDKYCVDLYKKTKIKKFLYGQETVQKGEENILGAMAVAQKLGMSQEEISKSCEKIKNKFGGIQFKNGINELNILDATYSANPNSVIAHLEYIKTWPGKKVIIMPCLIELGSTSKEIHQRIGKKIAEVCDLAIIITKDRFEEIKKEAGKKVIFLENSKEIFEKIKSFCQKGDIIILESRVPGQLVKQLLK